MGGKKASAGREKTPDELLLCDFSTSIVVQLVEKDLCPLSRLHLCCSKEDQDGEFKGHLLTAIKVVQDPNYLLHLLQCYRAWHQFLLFSPSNSMRFT